MKNVTLTIATISLLAGLFGAASAQAASVNYEIDAPAVSTTARLNVAPFPSQQQITGHAGDSQGEYLSYPAVSTTSSLSSADVRAQQQQWAATHNTFVPF